MNPHHKKIAENYPKDKWDEKDWTLYGKQKAIQSLFEEVSYQ